MQPGARFNPLTVIVVLLLAGVCVFLLASRTQNTWQSSTAIAQKTRSAPRTFYDKLAYAAEDIIDPTTVFDDRYVRIPYPNGDVSPKRGVCADVVIRAYRRLGIDLQVLVHEDMKRHFSAYPKNWGLRRPDTSIDHRRVYNLATFFKRHGTTLPISKNGADYHPSDIVVWKLQGGRGHIGIVSSQYDTANKRYFIVHNIGGGQVLEDALFAFPMIGHYRYAPKTPKSSSSSSS
ncbi:MAG: DUF1287 domain-containing protein [Armatimonadota bacterium]